MAQSRVRPPRSALRSASAPTTRRVFRGSGPARSRRHRLSSLRFGAITGGGNIWLRGKRSRQGIRPVTPFAHASPFVFAFVHVFPLRLASGLSEGRRGKRSGVQHRITAAKPLRLPYRAGSPSSCFPASDSPNEPIMHIIAKFRRGGAFCLVLVISCFPARLLLGSNPGETLHNIRPLSVVRAALAP